MSEIERLLVERAQKDPQAFGEIFDMHYDRIYAYVMRRIGDPDVTADIVAETFTKALDGISTFVWRGIPISAWLYRIAGNEIRMHARRVRGRPSTRLSALIEDGFDVEDTAFDEEREAVREAEERDVSLKAMRQALLTLPPVYQEAVVLRHVEGKTSAEVAAILGKNEGTTRSIISRGLSLLREAMASQQGGNSGIIEGVEGQERLIHNKYE